MSTRGALHLAESRSWLAWRGEVEAVLPYRGTLMEAVFAHWPLSRLDAFLMWYRGLPGGDK